ncbi:restriction endonuclease subunit S [Laspinema olomoucense]|uniref:restriction endonuclease subunit S n=1 Tax=Laspinema olomoucense TaxID=3231600 RepID=UPI0021BB02E3|nr:restriction endonuclease subunit S [Laspinema sp. D3c]MCT7996322.1 restriction endonuclease subunit S [Laspinema sp. D3c]
MMEGYGKYKDSGIEWIGEVPAHWGVKRLKDFSLIVRGGSPRPAGDLRFYEGNIPFLKVGDLTSNEELYLSTYTHTIKEAGLTNTRLIPKKSLLLTNSGATLGIPKICTFETTFNDGIAAFTHLKKINQVFLFYFLKSQTKWYLNQASLGQGQPNLNIEIISNTFIPYPPLPEQKAIAHYLDTKTAQIDCKIDLLTQKAQRYEELKRSLINETVTRGLDKSVPMKDSGIEWIGDIPAHWFVQRVKEIATLVLGKMLDNKSSPDKFYHYYLKSKNIAWFKVDISNVEQMYFTSYEMKNYRLKAGDLLLSEGGEVGKTSIWEEELDECYIQNSVHKVTVLKKQHPQYYLYQSVLLGQIKYYDSIVNQVSIKHLTKEKLSRVFWLCPPLEEQKAIAHYLDTKTAQIDQIIQTINTQIEKLKELRKTLINDVVTGKIKVIN